MKEITIIGVDEIVEINKILGGGILNRGNLDFLVAKIEAQYQYQGRDENFKRQIAKIASTMCISLIQNHPFIDGNKRTATESMQLFIAKNNYFLETSTAGLVYTSLKIANNETDYDNLTEWIYERLKEVKQ